MAKAKHKRGGVPRGWHPPDPTTATGQRGLRAFNAGHFDEAIAAWTPLAPHDERVRAALAEAHFRRGLAGTMEDGGLGDLRQAVGLVADEPRFHYHLGLALHRAGDLPAAGAAYRAALARDPAFPGAGLALATAALERDPVADLAALPGSTPQVRATLAPVRALLRGATPETAGGDAPAQLWRGLALIGAGDGAARRALDDERSLPAGAAKVRRYYRGAAAAGAGDEDAALAAWQGVHEDANGPHRPWLRQNLTALVLRRLEVLREGDDPAEAAALARVALPLAEGAGGAALGEALIAALDRGACRAAEAGDWARATILWERARGALGSGKGLGSPRSLHHNLALAYEAQERWVEAAESWRAMLRTRTRRPAAGDGGELSDAQWSWVRKRVIEDYRRADRPGEAVAIFRQAIKADPDALDLRVQLADALLANEQPQAAENELGRVLEHDPRHVEARLRLAAARFALQEWAAAEGHLRVALAVAPDRDDVRRQIAETILGRADQLHEYMNFAAAAAAYEEGAAFAPDDYRFPMGRARVAFDQRKPKVARAALERALARGADDPGAWTEAIASWAIEGKLDEARATLARAEAAITATPEFYIGVATALLDHDASASPLDFLLGPPPARQDSAQGAPWTALASELLERAVAIRPGDTGPRLHIAASLLVTNRDLALRYAEEAGHLAPDDPAVLRVVGLVQAVNDRKREAKETLRRAARLARQVGDATMAREIDEVRREVDSPFFGLALSAPFLGDLDLEDAPFL